MKTGSTHFDSLIRAYKTRGVCRIDLLHTSSKHPSCYEMVRPSGKQLLIRRLLCASHVWRDVAQLFQPLLSPIRMKELSRSQPVITTGHYQRFIKHPHVMRSPPIGIAKLSKVFMNNGLTAKYYIVTIALIMGVSFFVIHSIQCNETATPNFIKHVSIKTC